MRSDYTLYMVAAIFFILTGVVAAYQVEQQLWIVATAVIGFAFVGLGYSQRPRSSMSAETTAATSSAISSNPPAIPAQPTVEEVTMPEPPSPVAEMVMPTKALTDVKGIGEKRATQLKELGIKTVEDLAKASSNELAAGLKISPKITGKWVESAKAMAADPES